MDVQYPMAGILNDQTTKVCPSGRQVFSARAPPVNGYIRSFNMKVPQDPTNYTREKNLSGRRSPSVRLDSGETTPETPTQLDLD